MTRPVQWSREALDDLKGQIAYIATFNPSAARRIADQVRKTGMALADMPSGRPGRVAGTYEKVIPRLPYIIVYAITRKAGRDIVSILRVIHAARDWPAGEWPE